METSDRVEEGKVKREEIELEVKEETPQFGKFKINSKRDFKEISNIYRRTSINCTYNKKLKSITLVIPFNEQLNKYFIEAGEVDFLDNRDYLYNTLDNLNRMFNEDKLSVTFLIFLFIIYFIIFIGFIYGSILICLISLFNPMIIIFSIVVIIKVIKYLMVIHFGIKQKNRNNKIKKQITNENIYGIKKYNLSWRYGRDGSWLELIRKEADENRGQVNENKNE